MFRFGLYLGWIFLGFDLYFGTFCSSVQHPFLFGLFVGSICVASVHVSDRSMFQLGIFCAVPYFTSVCISIGPIFRFELGLFWFTFGSVYILVCKSIRSLFFFGLLIGSALVSVGSFLGSAYVLIHFIARFGLIFVYATFQFGLSFGRSFCRFDVCLGAIFASLWSIFWFGLRSHSVYYPARFRFGSIFKFCPCSNSVFFLFGRLSVWPIL